MGLRELLDDLHVSESELREILLGQKSSSSSTVVNNYTSFTLYRNPVYGRSATESAGNAVIHTFADTLRPPSNSYYVITHLNAWVAGGAGSCRAWYTITNGNVTVAGHPVSGSAGSLHLSAMYGGLASQPIVLAPNDTMGFQVYNFVGGAVNIYFTYRYYEVFK